MDELNLPAIAEAEQIVPLGPEGTIAVKSVRCCIRNENRNAVLEELKRSMGSADFAAQYQQEPIAAGGNLIKWSWFTPYDDPPNGSRATNSL